MQKEEKNNKQMVRILCLNCCLLPKHVYQCPGEDNRLERAQQISRLVQRYDIVLLQEVLSSLWSSEWKEMFTTIPNMESVSTVRLGLKKGQLIDSGLILLSRYPILFSSFHRFKNVSVTNKIVDRGFIHAGLLINEKVVHVINTHLNPDECHIGKFTPRMYREKQIEQIIEYKNSFLTDDPWIIGGDFNDDSLTAKYFSNYNISVNEPTSHSLLPFCLPGDKHYCIDYIVTNCSVSSTRRLNSLISDHYGVEMNITV